MNTNFKISIPKPCHENWDTFTPDEKGAFCKVCSKSVYDFTKKKTEEIKKIVVEQVQAGQKVCGRFNVDQLTPAEQPLPSLNLYSLNFSKLKKFAIALFLVFGGYLFNSLKSSAQRMGKVACSNPIKGDTVVYHYPLPKKDTAAVVKDSIVDPEGKIMNQQFVTGGLSVRMIEEPAKIDSARTINIEEPIIGDTIVVEDSLVEDFPMIMGEMVVPVDTIVGIADEPTAIADSTYVEVKHSEEKFILDDNIANIECYPNPSSSEEIIIRYNIKKDGMASISIFDINGNLVKTLLSLQSLYASSYEIKYDVSDLKNGVYFCELISEGSKSISRIVISK